MPAEILAPDMKAPPPRVPRPSKGHEQRRVLEEFYRIGGPSLREVGIRSQCGKPAADGNRWQLGIARHPWQRHAVRRRKNGARIETAVLHRPLDGVPRKAQPQFVET